MCDAEPLRVELINKRLVVGERLGGVPEEMPALPLAKDLAAQQRTVRLKPEPLDRALDLDLRKETDLKRSRLLRTTVRCVLRRELHCRHVKSSLRPGPERCSARVRRFSLHPTTSRTRQCVTTSGHTAGGLKCSQTCAARSRL